MPRLQLFRAYGAVGKPHGNAERRFPPQRFSAVGAKYLWNPNPKQIPSSVRSEIPPFLTNA
jgi:hypothetical protein